MYVLPCVSAVTMGYHVIHLMYVLVINLRFPPMNLCIGVGTRFSPTETSGSLYSSLCGLSIMNMNFLWCYLVQTLG